MRICCDIDGVLANVCEYVDKYLPQDWKGYFEHTLEFKPIGSTLKLLYQNTGNPYNDVLLVTGRPESNRMLTERWLSERAGLNPRNFQTRLYMRPDRDGRSGWIIKRDWFRELKPDLILDDDPEVVKLATQEGFTALQVHGFRCTENDLIPTNYLKE